MAEIPEDLMQLLRVHAHHRVGWIHLEGDEFRTDVLCEAEVADELLEPRFQRELLRTRTLSAAQLQDVFVDGVHAARMLAYDLGEAHVAFGELRRLREQLSRVTDRAERIADLVRDARG